MSDILIKNMDKPKSCFSDYKRCFFEMTSIDSKAHYCSLTGDRVYRAKIKSNCPIVEVKPHGRLIDADKLLKDLSDCEMKSYGYNGSCDDCEDRNISDVRVLLKDIEDAPTILEASE